MLASTANWQELISPSSMSIALLGHLLLVSTDADFPLTVQPECGFKLIKYPGSFRASLVQVSNSGWEAHNAAHVNMDQIRMLSAHVPLNMNQAIKWLVGGNKREVEVMLPGELAKIERTAIKSVSAWPRKPNRSLWMWWKWRRNFRRLSPVQEVTTRRSSRTLALLSALSRSRRKRYRSKGRLTNDTGRRWMTLWSRRLQITGGH